MSLSSLTSPVLALTGILVCLAPAASGTPAPQQSVVAIDDFSYVDTSGEPGSRDGQHQAKLEAFMATLRSDFAADDRYRLAPSSARQGTADDAASREGTGAATTAGAGFLVTGGIQKMSTLIQWAKVRVIDASTHHILFERLYTFRGDSDEAWRRAEMFVSQEVRDRLANSQAASRSAAAEPTRLAVFAFELEDTSAAAPSNGASAVDANDASDLTQTTDAVRKAIAQSPHYRLVDVGGAHADAVNAHKLRDCGGCDAAIARSLDADQSLVGVVRRVSRTEYTIRFQIRDTTTGAVVASADSGLRMGANYSWSRGAARLVSDRLLATQPGH